MRLIRLAASRGAYDFLPIIPVFGSPEAVVSSLMVFVWL
jgi:hypothetical protein